MKKSFKLDELDCAVCGQKMEDKIRKVEGVIDVNVSYINQKLTVEINDNYDFDAVMKEIVKVCKKVEPDCTIIIK